MTLRRRIPVSGYDHEKEDICLSSEHPQSFHRSKEQIKRRDNITQKVEWQDPDVEYKVYETDGHGRSAFPHGDFRETNGSNGDQFHSENQSIYRDNTMHSSKDRHQRVNKGKSASRHHDFNMDDVPEEMEEFFAWKRKNYEKEMQKLKCLPGKIPCRRAGSSSSYSSDDDINQNHLPGGGPPLSGSAMRNNLLGAIQLKRRSSNPSEEKFDPTKSIPNLSYQGPKEEPEPSTSRAAPPPAPPPDEDTGGDPMKNLLGAIQLKKPETDFIEETFDPTKSIPNLSYQSPVEEPVEDVGMDNEDVEEAPMPLSYDDSFVSSRSARVMNNQSSKEYTPPKKSHTKSKSKLARNSQTQTQDPPSLTSLLSAAQPERKSSLRASSNAGVDSSVNLVRPSLVKFSQYTQEYPIESLRDSRSGESTRGGGGFEEETIISSHQVQTREDLDLRGQGRRDARPLIKVNEDNTMSPVKFKHELNDIMRATSDDYLPNLPRELQSFMDKFHDVPLNKVMHFAETGSYIRESYLTSNICDIRVHVGKDTYPAHRIVLACFSPYLASVLEHENPLKHKKPKDIRISGVSERSVKVLLNYIYTGELRMETVLIPDIIKLADKFDVSVVRQKCFDHIDVLTDDELVALLSVMKDTHDVEYCDFIMRSISSKFMRVKDCKTFLQLDVDTLCLILTHGALLLRSEMDIFYSCLNWLQNVDANERCNYLDRVMECVRFPLMNHAELYECVERCSLLKSSTTCMQRIHEANWLMTMSMLHKQDPLRLSVPTHRNNVNSSASVSDYLTRTCSRVKSDVTVEVGRESCSPRYHSDPGMSRIRTSPSPSHGSPRNNNAECASEVSIYKEDQIYPANQMMSGTHSSNQMSEQEKFTCGKNASSTRNSESDDFSGRISSCDSQSTLADTCTTSEGQRSPGGSTSSKKRSKYKDSEHKVSKQDPSRNHSVVFHKQRMYIIGGCDTKHGVSSPRRGVLMYERRSRTWKPLAPLRIARMYHCLCVLNDQIYAIGGIGEENSILNTVECYDPSSNCWFFVKALKEARMGACASECGGQLFVAGGYGNDADESGHFPVLDSMECFDSHMNKWTLKRNLRYGRSYASLVSVGQSLYLSGGLALEGSSRDHCLASVNDVDEYDVNNDTWVWKKCLRTKRHSAGCFESGGKIYIFGGISSQLGHTLNDVECFNPQKNSVFTPTKYPFQVHWIKRIALGH